MAGVSGPAFLFPSHFTWHTHSESTQILVGDLPLIPQAGPDIVIVFHQGLPLPDMHCIGMDPRKSETGNDMS